MLSFQLICYFPESNKDRTNSDLDLINSEDHWSAWLPAGGSPQHPAASLFPFLQAARQNSELTCTSNNLTRSHDSDASTTGDGDALVSRPYDAYDPCDTWWQLMASDHIWTDGRYIWILDINLVVVWSTYWEDPPRLELAKRPLGQADPTFEAAQRTHIAVRLPWLMGLRTVKTQGNTRDMSTSNLFLTAWNNIQNKHVGVGLDMSWHFIGSSAIAFVSGSFNLKILSPPSVSTLSTLEPFNIMGYGYHWSGGDLRSSLHAPWEEACHAMLGHSPSSKYVVIQCKTCMLLISLTSIQDHSNSYRLMFVKVESPAGLWTTSKTAAAKVNRKHSRFGEWSCNCNRIRTKHEGVLEILSFWSLFTAGLLNLSGSASLHAKDAAASVFAAQNKLHFEFAAICLSPISLTSTGSDVRSGPVPISLLSLDLAPCAGCIGVCSMKTKTTNNILNSTVLCLASRCWRCICWPWHESSQF